MNRPILVAVVTAFVVCGVSYSQTGARPAADTLHERAANDAAAGRPQPEEKRAEEKQPLSKSLEKAKEEIGDVIEKTGETVRETLGLTKQGCLKQGNEADPYLLEQSKNAETITVVGSADLANHINHTVRLHGREEADGRVFHATTVEQIAASCDPLPRDEPDSTPKPRGELTAEPRGELNAGDQGTNPADQKLTQTIRQALVRDDTLSTQGQNIKIISRDGFVTLKGLVPSQQEKQSIEAKAVAAAGSGKVSNELTVQPASPSK